jgi:hypothetical protein
MKTVVVDARVLVDEAVDGFLRMWLRSGPFEEPATVRPPALSEDTHRNLLGTAGQGEEE